MVTSRLSVHEACGDSLTIAVAAEECEGCQAPATVSRDCGGGVAWWCAKCDAIASADAAE